MGNAVGGVSGAGAAGGTAEGSGPAKYDAAQAKAAKELQELQLMEAKWKPILAAAQKSVG